MGQLIVGNGTKPMLLLIERACMAEILNLTKTF